ncbi:hypothetical protein HAX54_003820, partial [Datura stramonium]|nr:hypothetical protein [Datura stramonium]
EPQLTGALLVLASRVLTALPRLRGSETWCPVNPSIHQCHQCDLLPSTSGGMHFGSSVDQCRGKGGGEVEHARVCRDVRDNMDSCDMSFNPLRVKDALGKGIEKRKTNSAYEG